MPDTEEVKKTVDLDTSGPAMNIVIKVKTIVSLIFASAF